ncbi:MAG TPA: type II glyceraldehyde-3-phosphate dehydrogenase [Chitinophagales bacterium]|nr:type II glyceraldehyde-3-phosphate dehydrogenase [Chitinophagales bacterium]
MKKVRVALNGYGVIGKRVADAVTCQDDMEIVGISDVSADWRIKAAVVKKYPVYASTPEAFDAMKNAGIPVAGMLDDLLKNTDVICDATPKKLGAPNLEKYTKAGVKSIFQGGEKHSLTGHSFTAQANYETAIGLNTTRVVSCNTTSIVRMLGALHKAALLHRAHGVLVRRATDPLESDTSGIVNTIVPELSIPSHQTPDAQTVVPGLEITTTALVAAETIGHFHSWYVQLTRNATKEEVIGVFANTPRVIFLKASEGLKAMNETLELMSDLGRSRGDMYEVGLWTESLVVNGNELMFNYQVYNQAIVVPETVDAVRALTGIEKNGAASVAKTNKAMGIMQGNIF